MVKTRCGTEPCLTHPDTCCPVLYLPWTGSARLPSDLCPRHQRRLLAQRPGRRGSISAAALARALAPAESRNAQT